MISEIKKIGIKSAEFPCTPKNGAGPNVTSELIMTFNFFGYRYI